MQGSRKGFSILSLKSEQHKERSFAAIVWVSRVKQIPNDLPALHQSEMSIWQRHSYIHSTIVISSGVSSSTMLSITDAGIS